MSKFALCIGINYKGTSNALRGCVNDKIHWAALFRGWGYAVVEMDDETVPRGSPLYPTGANIRTQLTALVDRVAAAGPGATGLWSYSGHGSQQRDTTGDESDGKDEVICPVDFLAGGMITDDEINKTLRRLPAGASFAAFMDCCHSGSGLDLKYTVRYSRGQTREIAAELAAAQPMAPPTTCVAEFAALAAEFQGKVEALAAEFEGKVAAHNARHATTARTHSLTSWAHDVYAVTRRLHSAPTPLVQQYASQNQHVAQQYVPQAQRYVPSHSPAYGEIGAMGTSHSIFCNCSMCSSSRRYQTSPWASYYYGAQPQYMHYAPQPQYMHYAPQPIVAPPPVDTTPASQPTTDVQDDGTDGEKSTVPDLPCANVIALSGCRDNQTSADAFLNGAGVGAFSNAILPLLPRAGGTVDLRTLQVQTNLALEAGGFEQVSVLSKSRSGIATFKF